MNKKVIIVAVHPDDETLMCGGTLLKHKSNGDKIYWLIVSNIFENERWSKERVENRQNEIEKVASIYQFDGVYKLDFTTTKLDIIPKGELIASISKVIQKVQPNIVYLPNRSDVHSDHQITFQAAYSCTKNFRYPFIERILMGETLSETEFAPSIINNVFIPNVFNDITPFFEKKLEVMKMFTTEQMEEPLPRAMSSIRALGRCRGSRIGVEYAEAFMLLYEMC